MFDRVPNTLQLSIFVPCHLFQKAYNPVKHLRWSFFSEIVNGRKPLTIFAKSSIIDVQLGSKYATALCGYTEKCFIYGFDSSPVIRLKGQISKRVFQKNKVRQILRKTSISYPLIRKRTYAYQGVRNVRFPETLACFVFLKHPKTPSWCICSSR